MTTDAQKRALWTAALHNLADTIRDGGVNPPSKLDLWTQYVTAGELLAIADFSYTRPLPIKLFQNHASVTVPTGELLGLSIEWISQCDLATDDREQMTKAFTAHNDECLPNVAPDADPVATQPTEV